MTEQSYDIIVIGAGPGGYVAAVRAAELGFKVACVEKSETLGGVCLNVGCIPSKALLDSSEYYHLAKNDFEIHGIKVKDISLDMDTLMKRKRDVIKGLTDSVAALLKHNKVTVFKGEASFISKNEIRVTSDDDDTPQTLTGKNILIATGSAPISVPGLEYDGENIVSSTEALSFKDVPNHLVIVGGGVIGLELGSVWCRLGAKVTVVEMLPQIGGPLDSQVGRTLLRILKKQGMDFKLSTKVSGASVSGKEIQVTLSENDKEETITCDKLLVAVGRKPVTRGLNLEAAGVDIDSKTGQVIVDDAYRTSAGNIYAIGDLTPGPMLAHKASAEGRAVVELMAGKSSEVDYDTIPGIIYTWPEVSWVGITEDTAKEKGVPFCTTSFPFSGSGRARCMGEKDGFVKIISHKRTDRILGVHILGPRASDLIAEAVVAMTFNASTEDIGRIVHGHPTFAEAVMDAAHAPKKCTD